MLRSRAGSHRKTVAEMIAEGLRKAGMYLIVLGGLVGISHGEPSKAVQAIGIGLLALIGGFTLEWLRSAPTKSDHLHE